jgi:hypothetical protein
LIIQTTPEYREYLNTEHSNTGINWTNLCSKIEWLKQDCCQIVRFLIGYGYEPIWLSGHGSKTDHLTLEHFLMILIPE